MSREFLNLRTTFKLLKKWLGWLGSNQRMQESKSCALPLGDIPMETQALYHKKSGLSTDKNKKENKKRFFLLFFPNGGKICARNKKMGAMP